MNNLNDEDYAITLNKDLNDVGRFFVTTAAKVLSTENIALTGVQIYTIDNATLRIAGLKDANATISLFNILGKQVMNT